MGQSLIGSRYELHVARKGAVESKAAHNYMAVYPGDTEESEEEDVVGYVHSYEVGSTVDGPGIRFVGFLTGCLLRCQFCHNPDTWHKRNGHQVPVSQAMRQIGKYAQVLKLSGGGITLSGGEPMVQRKFVTQIFRRCKALGMHTAMETSGRLGDRFTDAELRDIDLQILDIKGGDAATFEKVSGHPQAPTFEFARRLATLRKPIWVRFVLVPGLTDDANDIAQIATFTASLGNVERVEVLPFHQMGKFKWKELKLSYTLDNVLSPTIDAVESACAQFRAEGLKAY